MSDYVYDPVELSVQEYLRAVQSALVLITRPGVEELPDRWIQPTAVGGVERLVTQRPMVTFLCWDVSRAAAARFAAEVLAYLRGCRELEGLPVYEVRVVGLPVYAPDADTGRDRYRFTLEFEVRGRNFSPV